MFPFYRFAPELKPSPILLLILNILTICSWSIFERKIQVLGADIKKEDSFPCPAVFRLPPKCMEKTSSIYAYFTLKY